MKTKLIRTLSAALAMAGMVSLAQTQATSTDQSEEDAIGVVRNTIKADRQAVITQALQLTDQESKEFWPIYQQYRADMDKVGDGMVKMVKEYASLYPNIPDDRAKEMLRELTNLQEKQLSTRTAFLKKSGRVLAPSKNLRLAQVENRMDLLVQLKLAANIPLTPIEGKMTGETAGAALTEKGVPGGAIVQTYELTASVAAIDKEKRKVTLVDPSGIKSTVKCGPEVANFDQIQEGDKVQVTATERLVVFVAKKAEAPPSATGAEMVALAPKGAKPGAMMAETTQITAKITALDPEQHKATLQFEDGSTATVPVRKDVDLSKEKAGDDVVIRITEALAIKVVKP